MGERDIVSLKRGESRRVPVEGVGIVRHRNRGVTHAYRPCIGRDAQELRAGRAAPFVSRLGDTHLILNVGRNRTVKDFVKNL